ncbi:hypothetical protein G7054_g8831 [Neopestalotiopsis clavispora]|nr:hypothetical protein G7054_g8831 [Neopestalotiopsis clavispora]
MVNKELYNTMPTDHEATNQVETNEPAAAPAAAAAAVANLTTLPAELRLLIYGHLFQGQTKVIVTSSAAAACYTHKARKADENKLRNQGTWPILLTSRALFHEAWPSYWEHARVTAHSTWRQLPEALPPLTPTSRIKHLCLRIHTLTARWDQILPDLRATLPSLETLVIRDEDLHLEPTHWAELFGGGVDRLVSSSSSSSSSSSQTTTAAETTDDDDGHEQEQNPSKKIYHEIIAPCLFGQYQDDDDDDDNDTTGDDNFARGKDRPTVSKLRSRAALRSAAWPRHRVLYVPLVTTREEVAAVDDAASSDMNMRDKEQLSSPVRRYSRRRRRMLWFCNYGNGKMSLVADVDKDSGIMEVQ